MHEYRTEISWKGSEESFRKGSYSREHQWRFDEGVTVTASSSPLVVRVPYSRVDAVDPEEALVASIASCHMLTFLYIAQKAGFCITAYTDAAVGRLGKNEHGQTWLSDVELHPQIAFAGEGPDAAKLKTMHDQAHHDCYIAASVRSNIVVFC